MFRHIAVLALCLAATLLGPTAAARALTFAQPAGSPFGVGTAFPGSLVTADVNADGNPDVLTANINDDDVSVLFGNGSGGFSGPSSPSPTGGLSPRGPAVADFNGDGKLDVAVPNTASNTIAVLLGNGSGGFAPAAGSPLAAPSSPSAVVVSDFNRDGWKDLAFGNRFTNTVSVLLGDGTGGFASAAGSPFPIGGNDPFSIALADVNADSKPDLLTLNFGTRNVSVLIGNGEGGFTPETATSFPAGTSVHALAVGDVNGDGAVDLVVTHDPSSRVTVLLGNGSGGFSPASGSPFQSGGSSSNGISIGDLNVDGNADLVVANSDSQDLALLLGDGAGHFTAAPGSPISAPNITLAQVLRDFNHDGKPDLAAIGLSHTVTVFLNTSAPSVGLVPSALGFSAQPQGTLSAPRTVTVSNTGATPLHVGLIDLAGGDADDFLVSPDDCSGTTIAEGASCRLRVFFAPSGSGARSAMLSIPSDAPGGTNTVTLSGVGSALPQGPQGDPGADGAPGTDGADGTPGANGADGAPGASGTNGAPGADGAKGTTGATGATGASGATGPTGAAGPTGATGAAGGSGAAGVKGDRGPRGATGAKGDTGAKGATGARGRDAQIRCEPSLRKPTGIRITCTVRSAGRKRAVGARLLRGRRVVATGSYTGGRLRLTAPRAVPAGRYTLRLLVRSGRTLKTVDTPIRVS